MEGVDAAVLVDAVAALGTGVGRGHFLEDIEVEFDAVFFLAGGGAEFGEGSEVSPVFGLVVVESLPLLRWAIQEY